MNTQSETPLLCPTFSSYSRDGSVETATRVSNDYKNNIGGDENDDLFEFAPSRKEFDSPAQRKSSSIYPVFNREVLDNNRIDTDTKIESVLVVPLKALFLEEERENRISTSSSDESDSEAPEPNCMWRRKSIGSSPSASDCKKSKSTGSILFKRFKICDLLRSSSDGKESYMFSAKIDKSSNKIDYRKSPARVAGKVKAAPASSAHELFYVQNRSNKEGDNRKSFLPYRKDLIGFFSVLGRASRT